MSNVLHFDDFKFFRWIKAGVWLKGVQPDGEIYWSRGPLMEGTVAMEIENYETSYSYFAARQLLGLTFFWNLLALARWFKIAEVVRFKKFMWFMDRFMLVAFAVVLFWTICLLIANANRRRILDGQA